MSTDITRAPKICSECGKENWPTAARCWLCLTPLGGALQTTTAPAPGEVRFSASPYPQPTSVARSGCGPIALGAAFAVLTGASAGVTFFLTCSVALMAEIQTSGKPGDDSPIPLAVGAVAALAVATLVIVAFSRVRRR